MLAVVGRAARDGQVDAGAFGQSGGEVVVPFPQLVVGKSCSSARVMAFLLPRLSAMELPTALKWKTRPGYSESTPWKEALLMVPSNLSMVRRSGVVSDAVVLTRVGSDVAEDAQLVDVRVVFWVEAFYFRKEGCVGGVADSGVSKVSPFLFVF